MNYQGITIDGVWEGDSLMMSKETELSSSFFRIDSLNLREGANIDMRFPRNYFEYQSQDLRARSLLIEHRMLYCCKSFLHHGEIPPGCNSSFIALIPKVPTANLGQGLRPISLIEVSTRSLPKILSTGLLMFLGTLLMKCNLGLSCPKDKC
ncbi:hypothetical protein Tco_0606466 [Tanacetum coccineum]